jgi:hypothetical protein
MDTIGDIKDAVLGYLQVDEDNLIKGGVDLVLAALNRARKRAEQLHDWDCERFELHGTATDGIGLTSALVDEDDEEVSFKQAETFYILEDGFKYPLYHHSKKHGAVQSKEYMHRGRPISRYLSDSEAYLGTYKTRLPYEVYLHKGKYEIKPTFAGTKTIYVDALIWLPNYTTNADVDFFTTHGSEYLMWAAVVECNHLVHAFVTQQEGSISPPVKARDESLAVLKEYDSFMVESGRQPQ